MEIGFGTQVCGSLDEASRREWIVTDGLGGFAMGTVSGLRTRRYHGLLVVATEPPGGRRLGLAALDPVVVDGERRIELATREWQSRAVAPRGFEHLAAFDLVDGVPRWVWQIGDIELEAEVAMVRGRSAVGVVHRLLRAPGTVRLEVAAVATWRDVHGERSAAGDPPVRSVEGGFVFDESFRVRGPGYRASAEWWHGSHQREEAARGLQANEDLAHAGTFVADLAPGDVLAVEAWYGTAPGPAGATEIVAAARRRYHAVGRAAKATSGVDRLLAHAADQFIVGGPTVVAGYPWFGEWSRDTFTSYEGLFLCTGRADEGRRLLLRAAATISRGMLANTADVGGQPEYNTADATMWFLHALARHIEETGDLDLLVALRDQVDAIVDAHVAGTRFGIRVDPQDGLVTQGADGLALTWMDARVDGQPVTRRAGKTVEINALWISALSRLADLADQAGLDGTAWRRRAAPARAAFIDRFVKSDGSLFDVVDGPEGDDATSRPNQLIAAALPGDLLDSEQIAAVVRAVGPLLTPLGLRSLAPGSAGYRPHHRGDPASRDAAYHQGTVWPWLIGAYVEACRRAGRSFDGVLLGLERHLADFGLGSVSETADGAAPHAATGCPFQAWSVAELLRARRLVGLSSAASEPSRSATRSDR